MKDRLIYFDHAATTPVKHEVLEAMLPYFSTRFGNASTIYASGRDSKKAVEEARDKVAAAFGASSKEIFFTGWARKQITGLLKGLPMQIRRKETILLPALLSTMLCFILANIWKGAALR